MHQDQVSGYTTLFFQIRQQLEDKHLEEAYERNQAIRESVKKFCLEHGHLKSLQRNFKDTLTLMVDMDHKLAYCRHGKVKYSMFYG